MILGGLFPESAVGTVVGVGGIFVTFIMGGVWMYILYFVAQRKRDEALAEVRGLPDNVDDETYIKAITNLFEKFDLVYRTADSTRA